MALGVYPNPASDELTIVLSDRVENAHYTIQDLQGRIVQQGLFQGERITVSVRGLAPGPYLVRLSCENEMLIRQFVVE
ncbi:MAG: T9SS type A sorting domain-containing protein [Flavobacteriales bacterium]|nr:T9SS type A sorting domain-containing protein [Flavobacteriales bacterium]